MTSQPRQILAPLAVLAVLGGVLLFTSVPGVFTVDENSYLASILSLRGDGLKVPGTEGVTASRMLAYFDPLARNRAAVTSPIASSAPPLYAYIAFPFSLLGWRGLIGLNVLSFVVTGMVVFRLALSLGTERATPWLALGLFVLGGYSLEYAQGVWPHMLSVALAFGGVAYAARSRVDDGLAAAAAAGLLCGVATGVRYQNLVLSLAVGAGLLLAEKRRGPKVAAFTLGLLLPLAASSATNHVRLGSWNPVSKGPGWMTLTAGRTLDNPVVEGAVYLATKVVDYSLYPPPRDPASVLPWQIPYAPTNAYVHFGAVKKAWVQSSPWILLALVVLVVLAAPRKDSPARREARAFLLVVGSVLVFFAAAGFRRIDGVCFNQRYFLELVPILAVVFSLGAEGRPLPRRALLEGALLGSVLGWVPLSLPKMAEARHLLVFRVPVVLAALLVLAWIAAGRSRVASAAWPRLAGACLLWALVIHLGDDLAASFLARGSKLEIRRSVERAIPTAPSVLLARGRETEAFGPLQLDHDLVILDTKLAPPEEGRLLAGEYLGKSRRVFVYTAGMSREELLALAEGLAVFRPPLPPEVPLFELTVRTGRGRS